MTKKIFLYRFMVTLSLASLFGCTAPYAYQNKSFEDAVVIEATITNELKNQEIKLSRTYTLEAAAPKFETEAVVSVNDDLGNKYEFEEKDASYISLTPFRASPSRTYQLHILTKNGKSYVSSAEKLTTETSIESLKATPITKNSELGVEITVNSSDPTNTSKFYRYEYEETYKIVAPKWYSLKAIANFNPPGSYPSGSISFIERTTEARICYLDAKSNDLILTNTSKLSEDKVVNFPIRFISSKDPIIRNRYSILVKQYVQSLAAHTFFETLKEISNNGSILSQTQPGFFYGNIRSVDNPEEKVIGFFAVSSYSEKRLFFNFTDPDILIGERLPPYQFDCPSPIPKYVSDQYLFKYCFNKPEDDFPDCQGNLILNLIQQGTKVYFPNEGPEYLLYPVQCGDCTSFSSNIKPSFWID